MGGPIQTPNPNDPNQQLNQPPNQWQSVQQPPQQLPLETPDSIQQHMQQGGPPPDPLSQIQQSLAQQYQQQQRPPANGGRIKQLLSNFFSGAGDAMMHEAGLPTPYEQQQRTLSNMQAVSSAQANVQLHQAMAGMYGTEPIQLPDGSTINVQRKDIPKIQQGIMNYQGRTQSADTAANAHVLGVQLGQGIPVNTSPEMQQMGLPAQLPLKQAGQAQQLLTRPLQTVQGENGPSVINKLNPGAGGVPVPGVGNPRAMFAPGNRYVPVVDPNNPDNVTYMPAGQAARSGAASPQSAGFQANKAVTKSATSGPIANQLSAFNTALQHAELLRQANRALQNGDTRALNSLSNRAASEFGDPNLTNYQAIAGAYSREITKMLSGGHMTDAEIASSGGTLPSNANAATIDKVLGSYKSLAQSKINVLRNQVEQGKKGQPAFSSSPASSGGIPRFGEWKNGQRQ